VKRQLGRFSILSLKDISEKIHMYIEISRVGEISRRYFVMNAFDGLLTIIGVIMGSFISGVNSSKIIIGTGIAASWAMGVSGFIGALITEKSERERKVKDIEKAILTQLNGSILEKAERFAVLVAALIDGLSPLLVSFISISPLFLSLYNLISLYHSLVLSLFISIFLLFVLGLYLGKNARGNILYYGAIMVIAGIIVAITSTLIGEKI